MLSRACMCQMSCTLARFLTCMQGPEAALRAVSAVLRGTRLQQALWRQANAELRALAGSNAAGGSTAAPGGPPRSGEAWLQRLTSTFQGGLEAVRRGSAGSVLAVWATPLLSCCDPSHGALLACPLQATRYFCCASMLQTRGLPGFASE